MALPDRLEQFGIVLGSAVLLAPLASVLAGIAAPDPSLAVRTVLWLAPGAAVGALVAGRVVPVTYRQVWTFAVVGLVAVFLVDGVLRAAAATTPAVLAAGWLLAVVASAAVAAREPL